MNSKFQIQVALDFDQAGLQTLLFALNDTTSLPLQIFLSEYTEVYADFDCFMKLSQLFFFMLTQFITELIRGSTYISNLCTSVLILKINSKRNGISLAYAVNGIQNVVSAYSSQKPANPRSLKNNKTQKTTSTS